MRKIFFKIIIVLIKWNLFENLDYTIDEPFCKLLPLLEWFSGQLQREEIFQLKTDGRGVGEIRGTLHSLNTYPLINFENKWFYVFMWKVKSKKTTFRANSVTWNPHKLMGTLLQCSTLHIRENVRHVFIFTSYLLTKVNLSFSSL